MTEKPVSQTWRQSRCRRERPLHLAQWSEKSYQGDKG